MDLFARLFVQFYLAVPIPGLFDLESFRHRWFRPRASFLNYSDSQFFQLLDLNMNSVFFIMWFFFFTKSDQSNWSEPYIFMVMTFWDFQKCSACKCEILFKEVPSSRLAISQTAAG